MKIASENRWWWWCAMLLVWGGCSSGPGTDGEPSDKVPAGFPPAAKVSFDLNNRLSVSGTIDNGDEVVLFDIGALQLGDYIEVTCNAAIGSSLDPMIALFDADGARAFWNDDIDVSGGDFNAGFSGFIRHDSEAYFLGVASTSFFRTAGRFQCDVVLDPQAGIIPIRGQTVLLQWAAASDVFVADRDRGDLPDFDAVRVNPSFEGMTADLKQRVLDIVADDYFPYDVTITSTDEPSPDGEYTTVYFGTSTSQLIFGIADDVDFYNAVGDDNAIVFLQALGSITDDFDGTVQAIANVVSHEIGHTLGLMHTNDVTTLMDTTGADVTLLADQSFGVADIVDFPIGRQNAPQLLQETVGRSIAGKAYAATDGDVLRCGTCGATLSRILPRAR